MTTSTLLHEADPLNHEAPWTPEQRASVRQAVLGSVRERADMKPRLLVLAAAVAALFVVVAAVAHYLQSTDAVIAAVRFEIHLAENQPGPGLREASVSGTNRKIYLHNEVVVSNADIAEAHVVESAGALPSVGITFNTTGAKKIAQATKDHLGRPIAVLLDGQVVMTPTVKSAIGSAANINGDFTRAEVNRIVQGIVGR